MGVITFLVVLGAIVVAVILGAAVMNAIPHIGTANRKELRSTKEQLRTANRALRSIANGAGNPSLEAQIALDEIERKELEA